MRIPLRGSVGAAVLLCASTAGATETRSLGFDDRVACQEAIDRVYYSHRLETQRPFEEAVPREHLEVKVRTSLRQSMALDLDERKPSIIPFLHVPHTESRSRTNR